MSEHETVSSSPAHNPFEPLVGGRFIQLTTFRKNGDPVATGVWFAQDQGKLLVTTNGNAGKMKRLRNNGRALIAPSDPRGRALGEAIEVTARELPPERHTYASRLLVKKYGFAYRMFSFIHIFIGWKRGTKRTFLEIEPKSE
ncbi:MAG: PPOX class F420-dependent oxidoreductase [Ktedonobacteraceae bacterium]|nr:PPOX class F420-dependent oxidoreductase [Ktedonobacteraceae bacterium]